MSAGELLLPVFARTDVKAWPKSDGATISARYLPVVEAFRRAYPTDAHFKAYSVPEVPKRLSSLAPEKLVAMGLPGVTMTLLVFDIDGPDHEASAEWKESTRRTLEAFREGTLAYETRKGFRLVYRLAEPHVLRTDTDRLAWRALYVRACVHLHRATGLVADTNCADFTRFFRLPHATRKPEDKSIPASLWLPEDRWCTDPASIKPWLHTPIAPYAADDPALADDVELAITLKAEHATTWRSAVNDLEWCRPGHRGRAKKEHHAKANAARVKRAHEQAPPPDDGADLELAQAMSAVPVWVRGSLDPVGRAAANELACRGFDADRVASIIAHTFRLAGYHNDAASMYTKAREQALRVARGERGARWGACRKETPELYDVIDEHCARTHAPPPPPIDEPPLASAADAFARIEQESAKALERPGVITVIRSTTGAGKSKAVRSAIVAHKKHVSIFVQGHDVARTYEDEFGKLGVVSKRGEGVAAVLDADGEKECKRLPAVEALAIIGVMPREKLCPECPYRTGCSAAERGTVEGAIVRIDQASITHRLTAHFAAKLKSPPTDDKPVFRSIVIDEPPALTASHKLDSDSARAWRGLRGYLTHGAFEKIDQIVHPVLVALDRVVDGVPVVRDGMSLRDLLGACGFDTGPEQALAAAREVPDRPWNMRLTERLIDPNASPEAIALVKHGVELAEVIIEAAHRADAPLLSISVDDDGKPGARALTVRAAWTRQVRAFVEAGGSVLLLDATAHREALTASIGEHEFVLLDVADAVGVDRVVVKWGNAARRRHTIGSEQGRRPNPEKLIGPLRDLANRIREHGARHVGVLSDKPTAIGLRDAIAAVEAGATTPELVPEELAELVREGVKLDVGWYCNQRGSNRWQDVDLLATIGDPHPNIGDAQASAVALGLERNVMAEHCVDSELIQAWGRARTVHRTKPVLVVAYTNLEPNRSGMAPQWHGASRAWLSRGRPTTANPATDPAGWALERAATGVSQRAHAVTVGLPRTTYQRVESKNPDQKVGQGWPVIASKRKAIDTAACTDAPSKTSSAQYRATTDPPFCRPFLGLPTDQPEELPEAPTFTHTTEVYDAPVTNDPAELDGVQVEATDVDLVACNIPRFAEPDDVTDEQPEEREPAIANDNPRRYWWEGRAPSPPIHQPANDPPRALPLEQLIAVSRGGGSVRGAGVRLPGSGMAACGRSEVPRRRTWWSR